MRKYSTNNVLLIPTVAALLIIAVFLGISGIFLSGNNSLTAYACADCNALTTDVTDISCPTSNSQDEDVGLFSFIKEAAGSDSGEYVSLGGYPLGITLKPEGVILTSKTGVVTSGGVVHPLQDIEIVSGDLLTAIDGRPVRSVQDIADILENSSDTVKLTIRHAGVKKEYTVTPATDSLSGKKRLGIMLQEGINGVGTLTFVTDNGRYAALGHPVKDSQGNTIQAYDGNIYPAVIKGSIRGERGKAGELQGVFTKDSGDIGGLDTNNTFGIFGKYTGNTENLQRIQVADRSLVQPGKAQIFSTVEGSRPKLYDIEIVKAENQATPQDKSMFLRVTDKELLEKTGGIVQGMSGSPIIQNGKLVGAVTHVLINDPTKGYGIYAQWMLDR